MDKIGEYEYPTLTSFSETLEIAREANDRFAGFMPYIKVSEKLGYNIKNPAGISGYIYRRFDEMCAFGLFKRERGGIRLTDLARDALNNIDQEKAKEAITKAIYKFPIIKKAFFDWNGEIPDDDALPTKLAELVSVDYNVAEKHSEAVKRFISDCFRYLKASGGLQAPLAMQPSDRREINLGDTRITTASTPSGSILVGELKTTIGTVLIRNKATLELAKNLLNVLEKELPSETSGEPKSESLEKKDKGKEKKQEPAV
jgi:hypothetical protein